MVSFILTMNRGEKCWQTQGMTLEERLMFRVLRIPESTCWYWDAWVGEDGYGRIGVNGKLERAHRVSYELFRGPIPTGLHLDHLCRERSCVNPYHLEPVTCQENVLRSPIAIAANHARKTHCPSGHPYTPENTYSMPGTKWRQCKICARERERVRQLNKALKVA